MFTIFLRFSISIGVLTIFSLKNQSPNEAEIKITLSFMAANSKSLLKNIKTLLLLLLKDLFPKESKNPLINIESSSELNFQSTNQDSEEANHEKVSTVDDDSAISGFSSQVIQLIEEEENKAA